MTIIIIAKAKSKSRLEDVTSAKTIWVVSMHLRAQLLSSPIKREVSSNVI